MIIKTCSEQDIKQRLTSKFFPSALANDLLRFPTTVNLISEASLFSLIEERRVSINTILPKDVFIKKLLQRGASNIGMLSQDELEYGIERIKEFYDKKQDIQMTIDNTFFVFQKL